MILVSNQEDLNKIHREYLESIKDRLFFLDRSQFYSMFEQFSFSDILLFVNEESVCIGTICNQKRCFENEIWISTLESAKKKTKHLKLIIDNSGEFCQVYDANSALLIETISFNYLITNTMSNVIFSNMEGCP